MIAPSTAFASFEQKWLAEYPENLFVALFLPVEQRQCAAAFGALIHELAHTAFRVRETQVAAAKLAWWQQELAEAPRGKARHPITQRLFVESPPGPAELWPALAATALGQLDDAPAASMEELVERLQPFHAAVARAEAALFNIGERSTGAAALPWTISHILRELATGRERAPVPLDLLARHGIARPDLDAASAARSALVRDYLAALQTLAPADGTSATLPRRVRTRLDVDLMRRAWSASDPLTYLQARTPVGRWQALWATWREARASASAGG